MEIRFTELKSLIPKIKKEPKILHSTPTFATIPEKNTKRLDKILSHIYASKLLE